MERLIRFLVCGRGYNIVQKGKYLVKLRHPRTNIVVWVSGTAGWIGEQRSVYTRWHTIWNTMLDWEKEHGYLY